MTEYLKIRMSDDDDGSAGLIAMVRSGNFSGEGEAWFNKTDIIDFYNQLTKFIENKENPPTIEGGHRDGKGNLKEVLLSLKFYLFSDFRFGVQISLADHPYTNCRKEEISRVSVELKPDIHNLLDFCDDLDKLLLFKTDEAILECSPSGHVYRKS